MSKMNVITGGRGYVGYALVKELADRGEKMRLLLRSDSSVFDEIECEKVFGDITNVDDLVKAFEGADVVYHVAGLVDTGTGYNEKLWNVNFGGTKNVVEACKKCGVKTLIYVSSVDAIAVDEDAEYITEADSFDPDLLEGEYGKTKAAATQYVLDNASDDLRVCVVHPSCCIGPYDNNETSMMMTMMKLYYKGFFSMTFDFGGYNFVDVRDVAKGMVAAAEKGRNGECYILSGYTHTLNEFMTTLAYVCGKKPPKITVKRDFLSMNMTAIEAFFKATKMPPVLNDYTLRKICENCRFSCEKARYELGYQPRELEDAIKGSIEWLLERENSKGLEKSEKELEFAKKELKRTRKEYEKAQEEYEKAKLEYEEKKEKHEKKQKNKNK